MWESPIYKFKAKIGKKQEQVFIDVTGSAPNFSEPGKQLESTFKTLLKNRKPKDIKILDFGAAKLRNTIYLLRKGYTVYACEFGDLFKRSNQANEYFKAAKKFKNFKPLVFPNDFVNVRTKFDVILLINVINIMPVPIERLLVLTLCKQRIKNDGYLLWYTQHGAYDPKTAFGNLNDGLITGKGRKYHMFYRDFTRLEIHNMLKSTGFSHNKKFTFAGSGSNQAYVFDSDGSILIERSLGLTKMLKSTSKQKFDKIPRKSWGTKVKHQKVVYDSKQPTKITKLENINIIETYLNELLSLLSGNSRAHKYHELIFSILKLVFDHSLTNPKKEEYIADDTKRVDITFSNQRKAGFFKQLAEGYNIQCPNIFIECKNYTRDLKNPEFAQIQTRLNPKRGVFGILVCREFKNKTLQKKRQIEILKDNKFVIIFEDSDIKKLVKWRMEEDYDQIDNLLETKFRQLI